MKRETRRQLIAIIVGSAIGYSASLIPDLSLMLKIAYFTVCIVLATYIFRLVENKGKNDS